MAEPGQVAHRAGDAPRVVDDDAGHVGHGPVQHDQRPLLGHHPDRRVRHPRAGQHDALDGGQRPLEGLPLDQARLLGVGQQHRVARRCGGRVGPLDDREVERVGDVRDDQRDRRGAGRAVAMGHGRRPVAQLPRDLADAFCRLGLDPPGPRERARHGRRRHPGRPRDVVDGRTGFHGVTVRAVPGPTLGAAPPASQGATSAIRTGSPGVRRGVDRPDHREREQRLGDGDQWRGAVRARPGGSPRTGASWASDSACRVGRRPTEPTAPGAAPGRPGCSTSRHRRQGRRGRPRRARRGSRPAGRCR